jgi:hypothetical protein
MAKVINQIKLGDNTHNIASTAYATCSTPATTAAKVAYIQGESSYASGDFVLTTGVTVHVKFTNANSVANPTLNINGTGAKSIKRYGTTAPSTSTSSSWYAGEVVALTYDGTYWQMNKGITDGNTDTKAASGDTSTKIYLIGATSQSPSGQTTYSHSEVYVDTDHFLTDTVGFRAGDLTSSTDYKNGQIVKFDTATLKNNTFTLPEASGTLATQEWTYGIPTDTIFTFNIPNNVYSIGIGGVAGVNVQVNWGDGTTETLTTTSASHIYNTAGIYTCKITGCTALNGFGMPFSGASSLIEAVIGNGVTKIDSGMFQGCTNLRSVYLPKSLRTIGIHSFSGCSSLSNVVIPEGLTSIDTYVFADCTRLKTIVIPESVTNIGFGAFKGCSGLQEITLPVIGSGSQYTHFGSIFEATDPGSHGSKVPASLKKVTVTAGKSFGYGAFQGCLNIESIILPDSLETTDSSAFSYLDNLKYIEFGTGFTNNGYAVGFSYCNKLEKIVFKSNPPELFFRDSELFWNEHPNGIHIVVPKKYLETCKAALKEAAEYVSQFTYYDIDNTHIIPDVDLTEDYLVSAGKCALQWSEDLITKKTDLSGTTLEFNTDTHWSSHWNSAVSNLLVSSGGYRLYVSGPPHILFYKPDGTYVRIYESNGDASGTWHYTSLTLPDDFGYITEFHPYNVTVISDLNIMIKPFYLKARKAISIEDKNYLIDTDEAGSTLASREWTTGNFAKQVPTLTPVQWTDDLITNKTDLSGATIIINPIAVSGDFMMKGGDTLFKSSGGYYISATNPPTLNFNGPVAGNPNALIQDLYYYSKPDGIPPWSVTELVLPDDFGYITEYGECNEGTTDLAKTTLNSFTTAINVPGTALYIGDSTYMIDRAGGALTCVSIVTWGEDD